MDGYDNILSGFFTASGLGLVAVIIVLIGAYWYEHYNW